MNEMKSILQWLLISKFSTGKNFASRKWLSKDSTSGFSFIKGPIPLWVKWKPSFHEDYCLTKMQYGHFAFWKRTLQGSNFGVTVYKGIIPPWLKWNTSFNDDYFLNFLQVKKNHCWLKAPRTFKVIFRVQVFFMFQWLKLFSFVRILRLSEGLDAFSVNKFVDQFCRWVKVLIIFYKKRRRFLKP